MRVVAGVSDGTYARSGQHCTVCTYQDYPAAPDEGQAEKLCELLSPARTVGLEPGAPLEVADMIAAFAQALLPLVESLRLVKSPADIDLLRHAARYCSLGVTEAIRAAYQSCLLLELFAKGHGVQTRMIKEVGYDPLLSSVLVVGRRRSVLIAGVGPDLSWYATYPPWVVLTGRAAHALRSADWPDPPGWMLTLHHASHSLPVALVVSVLVLLVRGRFPKAELAAWLLHILVDIPTHSRRFWGPQFLWPMSRFALDGIPWAEISSRVLADASDGGRDATSRSQGATISRAHSALFSLHLWHSPTSLIRGAHVLPP